MNYEKMAKRLRIENDGLKSKLSRLNGLTKNNDDAFISAIQLLILVSISMGLVFIAMKAFS